MNYSDDVLYDTNIDDSSFFQFTEQDILRLFGSTLFNSSYCLTAELIHFCKEFEDEQYHDINSYFCSIIRPATIHNEPSASLLNLMLDIYIKQLHEERYPTLDEIVDEMFTYRCVCLYFLPETDLRLLLKEYVLEKCDIPKCSDCHILIQYFILHKTLPSESQLSEFILRTLNFIQSPEEYHQQDKIRVPTLCIDQLPITTITPSIVEQDRCCPLCQTDFELDQKIITLLPCNHMFHHTNQDCLENSSIITWLNENNYCPMCKTQVQI